MFLTFFADTGPARLRRELAFMAWRSALAMQCSSGYQELDSSHPANTGGMLSSVAEQPQLGKR